MIFTNCAPFTNFISEINNTQVHHAHDSAAVIPKYNLIELIQEHQEVYGSTIEINQP